MKTTILQHNIIRQQSKVKIYKCHFTDLSCFLRKKTFIFGKQCYIKLKYFSKVPESTTK